MFHHDFPRQFLKRLAGEEEAGLDVNVRRRRPPLLAGNGIGVKNRPDRAAPVMAVADARQSRVDEIARVIFRVFGVEIAVRLIRIDAQISAVAKVARGLIVEAPTQHVDENEILPIFDRKSYGASLAEYRATRVPAHVDIAVLAADRARLGDSGAKFTRVIEQSPERGANVHGGKLAAGVLVGPRHAGEPAIFLGEAGIERAAEIDIAR